MIQFGFYLKKLSNWILKKKPNRNRFKPTSFGLGRFGFFWQKPVQTGLARFWIGFFGLTWFFLVFFCLGSVRFFRFQTYKTETEPVGFFKILIDFFTVGFFRLFFSGFLNLLGILIFLLIPTHGWAYFSSKQKKKKPLMRRK